MDGDDIWLGVKSDLLAWLEDISQPKSEVPPTSCIVLDGAVVIQLLKPATAKKLQRVCTAGLYALHALKILSRHATGPGVGPLHYRLIEGYSKSQAGKRGEKTSGE